MLEDPKNKKKKLVLIDVASYQIIPFEHSEEGLDGTGIWSIYDNIPHKERQDRIARWEADDKLRDSLSKSAEKSGLPFTEATVGEMEEIDISYWFISKHIPLTLHGQQHCVWCAPATGQMLLKYHNYYYEQIAIVNAMGTIWDQNIPPNCNIGGTGLGGQVAGYEFLSRNFLDAVLDLEPTWWKAKSEIDEERPLKSGVRYPNSGHARACSGYSRIRLQIPQPVMDDGHVHFAYYQYELYICDPWPVGPNNSFCNPQGGQEGWEPLDAPQFTHSNFIYLRPCSGTMICQE